MEGEKLPISATRDVLEENRVPTTIARKTDIIRYASRTIYQNASSQPATPSTNSGMFDATTGTFTPPSNWALQPTEPPQGERIWETMVQIVFNVANQTTSITYGTPHDFGNRVDALSEAAADQRYRQLNVDITESDLSQAVRDRLNSGITQADADSRYRRQGTAITEADLSSALQNKNTTNRHKHCCITTINTTLTTLSSRTTITSAQAQQIIDNQNELDNIDASVSGNTLTITLPDGTTVPFTVSGGGSDSGSGGGQLLNK